VQVLEETGPAQPALPTFDDSNVDAYWTDKNPLNLVKVAGHGVTVIVTGQSGYNLTVNVAKPAS